jgi:molybdopterin/thiamine biosynthesis adenylyltransferase
MDKLVIIGLGGIGGALAEPLCRYLDHSDYIQQVKLVDGDRYEARNAERQQSVTGQNKADAWAKRLAGSFTKLTVGAVGSFITPDNIRLHLADNSIIMLCVDNHATRLLVQEHCSRLRNVTLISGGNDYYDGNVQVFARKNGRGLLPPITCFHPEIESPADRRPDELGCDEELPVFPQLLFANFMAASLMLNALFLALQDQFPHSEIYFDLRANAARPFTRTNQLTINQKEAARLRNVPVKPG